MWAAVVCLVTLVAGYASGARCPSAMAPGSHWDLDVSNLPVHPASASIVANINDGDLERGLRPDFAGHSGSGQTTVYYGIPCVTVDSTKQSFPPGPTTFFMYGSESDKTAGVPAGSGRYPFPVDAPIEGTYPGCSLSACNTDRHVLAVDTATCTLYEAWKCDPQPGDTVPWRCANGAAFNLSNPLLPQRPLGWTSADAAGLPIYPGLVKVEEVKAGAVNHAIRFTARYIRAAYAYPASHLVTGQGTTSNRPWMGLRARLYSSFNCSSLVTPPAQVICAAVKNYGVILADVGSPWFMTGEASVEWENYLGSSISQFHMDIRSIKGKYMEVVVPPGHCLCTQADCKDTQGNFMCPPAKLPAEYPPYVPPSPPPSDNNSTGPPPPPPEDPSPAPIAARLSNGSCAVLPGSHFSLDVSGLPLHPNSAGIVEYISGGDTSKGMHADFAGHDGATVTPNTVYYGIPFTTVDSRPSQQQSYPPGPTDFYLYPTESDVTAGVPAGSGRYPFPADAPIELAYPGCSMLDCDTDRHVLVVDNYTCTLFEAWKCEAPSSTAAPWSCANGAAFNLSNPLLPQRPLGWTSADAAGLPIYPGLVKVEEVKAGAVNHAIRFTSRRIRDSYSYPASHLITGQGGTGPYRPWMGLRARLRNGFACTNMQTTEAQVICKAMKKYGLILADAGMPWFLTGEASPEWETFLGNKLSQFRNDIASIKAADMEVVTTEDHCLCTNAECLTDLGAPMCNPPVVPGTPYTPPAGTHVVVQTGRSIKRYDDSIVASYNGTVDAGISTQYSAGYNFYQGVSYYWGTPEYTVSDTYRATESFRALLRFGNLHEFLPSGATIKQALLNLTFVNWDPTNSYVLQACPLTKPWAGTKPEQQYTGVGWQYTGVLDRDGAPIHWSQPGGWGDCGSSVWSVNVPPGQSSTGYIRVSLPIPASTLQAWVANGGAQNYGLLLRASAGKINLRMSQNTATPAARPALDIFYEGGDTSIIGWSPEPEPTVPSPSPAAPEENLPPPPAARLSDGSCAVLPGSQFSLDVSGLPLHPESANLVTIINDGHPERGMHADFAGYEVTGAAADIPYGIPFVTVDSNPAKQQPFSPGATIFNLYASESDVEAGVPNGSGRYPFPVDAPIEGAYPGCSMADCNNDRHVLAVDNYTCTLYEAWRCQAPTGPSAPWSCANGAAFNLSNPLLPQRTIGWTSADAAGLPIYPGLVKVDEIKAGAVNHAVRFTSRRIMPAYAYPASHLITGRGAVGDPWLGLRARLRSGFACTSLTTQPAKVICAALKKYGVILADSGSGWYLTGEGSSRWHEVIPPSMADAFAADMAAMKGTDMEVVMPPDHCLCTIPQCLNWVGTKQCLDPKVPGTADPPAPTGTRVVVQTGLSIPQVAGGVTASYNGTIDASISTQYLAGWNDNQGTTYFWPTAQDHTITEQFGSAKEQFRTLLRFNELHKYVPAGATINQALLNLTLLNWEPGKTNVLQVCVVKKPWVETQPAAPATVTSGLGWKLTGVNSNGPVAWTTPGGWDDCGATWSVPVMPGHERSGMMQVSLPLPASIILTWLANNGANNFGVLLRCDTGTVSLRPGQHAQYPSVRPLLDIYYATGSGYIQQPDTSPAVPSPSPVPSGGNGGGVVSKRLVVQTGLNITRADGMVLVGYNGTVDGGISTQYYNLWNNFQGTTYYFPTTPEFSVADNGTASAESFRPLIKFGLLHQFLPAAAIISEVRLNLTFVNWASNHRVQVCALTKRWVGTQPPTRFSGLGWQKTGTFDNGEPVSWSKPGAWADCDDASIFNMTVPGGNGLAKVSLTLPSSIVSGWVANDGAANYGLLLRGGTTSRASLRLSQYTTNPSQRPLLDIRYQVPVTAQSRLQGSLERRRTRKPGNKKKP